MQILTLKRILVAAILATVLLAMAPAALPDDGHKWQEQSHYKMGKKIKSIEVPITVTGMKDNSATFTVKDVAIVGEKDKAAVVTFDQPLAGSYNLSNDMAYISTKGIGAMDMGGMNIRVETANNSSLPVSGSSGILGMGKIRVEYKGKDYSIAEFSMLSIHLPDGTVKSYNLEKPVKVIKSKDRKMVVWDAYPSFTGVLKDAFQAGQTFPADAAPVKLSDLMSSDAGAVPMSVTDTRPQAVQPPT